MATDQWVQKEGIETKGIEVSAVMYGWQWCQVESSGRGELPNIRGNIGYSNDYFCYGTTGWRIKR